MDTPTGIRERQVREGNVYERRENEQDSRRERQVLGETGPEKGR